MSVEFAPGDFAGPAPVASCKGDRLRGMHILRELPASSNPGWRPASQNRPGRDLSVKAIAAGNKRSPFETILGRTGAVALALQRAVSPGVLWQDFGQDDGEQKTKGLNGKTAWSGAGPHGWSNGK
jgi:hypothetical protein